MTSSFSISNCKKWEYCHYYFMTQSKLIFPTCLGVSSSLILLPSNKNRKEVTGTPWEKNDKPWGKNAKTEKNPIMFDKKKKLTTLSLYDFLSFPIWVVIFTLKWISFESWPTTFSLMYSEPASPSLLSYINKDIINNVFLVEVKTKCSNIAGKNHGMNYTQQKVFN